MVEEDEAHQDTSYVTPGQTAIVGAGVLLLTALLTGASHYTSTSKAIAEEGIEARARLRAMPIAVKALGASTLVCAGMTAAAIAAWQLSGMEARDVAAVASWTDAVALAKQQRVSQRGITP